MSVGSYMPNNPNLEPTHVPSAIDIALAAGWFESEGTVGTHKSRKTGPAVKKGISVIQYNPWMLERLRKFWGGSISSKGTTWSVSGIRACKFANDIYGLLSPHRQAQVMRLFPEVF